MYNSAIMILFTSNTIYIVLTCFFLTLILIANELNIKMIRRKSSKSESKTLEVIFNDSNINRVEKKLKVAPGPKPKFIVGNLDAMDGYGEVPYQAFSVLSKVHGNIIKLQLGSVPSMVINGVENIKEVLVKKGHHFDSRPNFRRYHLLFSGNKNNSLAFCDWSDIQKARRDMLISHTFPRKFSMNFNRISSITTEYLDQLSSDIMHSMKELKAIPIKPIINATCANIFTQYFTTRSFEKNDAEFQKIVKNFDKIFWEINQGYCADFLPFLLPLLHRNNLKKMENWSQEIRRFVTTSIVGDRFEKWSIGNEPNDYIESLIDHVKQDMQPSMDWETALFALEDIIGGFSAVSNFIVKVLAFVTKYTDVQTKIQEEIDNLLNERDEKTLLIEDRNKLIFTEATIMEALRMISSPIVPHVANQNSSIDGYEVKAGTLLFLNNYDLNMSPDLWHEPEKFDPTRFIQNGRILKPDHFIPFGMGRRSCMGYKIVQFLSFATVGNLLKQFDIRPLQNEEVKVPVGSLALSESPFQFAFNLRN